MQVTSPVLYENTPSFLKLKTQLNMPRLDQEKQKKLEPKRMEYAKSELAKRGIEITKETKTTLQFTFIDSVVTLYPYSGWHTGKSIVDGRGIEKLLKQLDN